jgi:splicing factor 3A subunit 3
MTKPVLSLGLVVQPNLAEETDPQVQFSGEEFFGKYLDLHALYVRYYSIPHFEKVCPLHLEPDKCIGSHQDWTMVNSEPGKCSSEPEETHGTHGHTRTWQVDYLKYLENFYKLDQIPEQRKNATYAAYLKDLFDYLLGFFKKTQPLVDEEEVVGSKVGPLGLGTVVTTSRVGLLACEGSLALPPMSQ